ncbi:GIY-YIG nuclease family protein [Subtercola endophyticus]|uniref:GIY-YIG nuclease family protein n=1 Tax=Subtercola endophyticus TaxID=2895559 RepID=UPI001E3DF2E4|nr:GIY-YIG nuclease family protein [Subtercola endophyticus]UFS59043.1 GIY-YIG nuclease family protein [Subtercola endophyticus]
MVEHEPRASSPCGARLEGEPACGEPAAPGSSLNLCTRHLLAAYDEVAADVGVTDALPSPCLACSSRLGVRYPSGWLCAVCEWKYGDVPDPGSAAIRVDVVYYVRAGERIKIGTSANPRGRLAQLHFDELLAFERGDRHLERRRHAQFGAHRVAGSEWFAVHDELLQHIHLVAAGVGDPFDLYRRWVSEAVALRG